MVYEGKYKKMDKEADRCGTAAACMALTGVMMTVWGEESQVVEGTAMGRYVETKLALPEGLVGLRDDAAGNGGIRILGKIYGEENSSGLVSGTAATEAQPGSRQQNCLRRTKVPCDGGSGAGRQCCRGKL